MLWKNTLQYYFKELKHMVSDETLLGYTNWAFMFSAHNYDSDKQLVVFISQNNKPIAFFKKTNKPKT